MLYLTRQIKGAGRGRKIGFPTINLSIDESLDIDDGIYAAWVTIADRTYMGALHFGPVPTFHENKKTLEVYLLDTKDSILELIDGEIEIDFVKKIREIENFQNISDLSNKIAEDVKAVIEILG